MKNPLLAILWILGLGLPARAQDSTQTRGRMGFRVAADVGLLNNNSLGTIWQQLQQTGLDASGVGNQFTHFVLSVVRDYPKSYSETRFLLVNSENIDPVTSPIDKRVTFYGYGFGGSHTFKLINNRRFRAGPSLGYDFMWYRLRILPQNSQNLSLGTIVANPAFYSTIKLRHGFYMNVFGSVGADYKTGWFPKIYDDLWIGARISYQLPLVYSDKWRYTERSCWRSSRL